PLLLKQRPLPCPELAILRQRIHAFRRRHHHVLHVDDHAKRVAQRFQRETEVVDGGHAAVLATADHHQQVRVVDPYGGLHAWQRAHGDAGGFVVDRAPEVGWAHVAHQVLVHGFDMAAHGALVAGEARRLDAGKMADRAQRVGAAPGHRRLTCRVGRVLWLRLAATRHSHAAPDEGHSPDSHVHPFPTSLTEHTAAEPAWHVRSSNGRYAGYLLRLSICRP